LTSGTHRVDLVGLGMRTPSWAFRSFNLDNVLTQVLQESGQPGAIASGSFDSPATSIGKGFDAEVDELAIAALIGGVLAMGNHSASRT